MKYVPGCGCWKLKRTSTDEYYIQKFPEGDIMNAINKWDYRWVVCHWCGKPAKEVE